MGRRLKMPKTHLSYEFELDLAPLLAVMVKLVPVLLISSAFVQLMVIETDLPQAVKEAVQTNQPQKASIQLEISIKQGIKVIVEKGGKQKVDQIKLKEDGAYDLQALHTFLLQVKQQNPDVFRIELAPDKDVPYRDIVKIMDMARKSRDRNITFPIFDKKENKQTTTDYMFPDVVFTNMMDG